MNSKCFYGSDDNYDNDDDRYWDTVTDYTALQAYLPKTSKQTLGVNLNNYSGLYYLGAWFGKERFT